MGETEEQQYRGEGKRPGGLEGGTCHRTRGLLGVRGRLSQGKVRPQLASPRTWQPLEGPAGL